MSVLHIYLKPGSPGHVRFCLIINLLLSKTPHKIIAHRCGCTKTTVSNIKRNYTRENVTLRLTAEAKRILEMDQQCFDFVKVPASMGTPRRKNKNRLGFEMTPEQKKVQGAILRSLGKKTGV